MIKEISRAAQALGINIKSLLAMAEIDQSTFYKWHREELTPTEAYRYKLEMIFIYLQAVKALQEELF